MGVQLPSHMIQLSFYKACCGSSVESKTWGLVGVDVEGQKEDNECLIQGRNGVEEMGAETTRMEIAAPLSSPPASRAITNFPPFPEHAMCLPTPTLPPVPISLYITSWAASHLMMLQDLASGMPSLWHYIQDVLGSMTLTLQLCNYLFHACLFH